MFFSAAISRAQTQNLSADLATRSFPYRDAPRLFTLIDSYEKLLQPVKPATRGWAQVKWDQALRKVDQAKPCVYVYMKEGLVTHYHITEKFNMGADKELEIIPRLTEESLRRALAEGLAAFWNQSRAELATRWGHERKNDMRLLRHVGLFYATLLEFFHYLLKGETTDGIRLVSANDLPALVAPRVMR